MQVVPIRPDNVAPFPLQARAPAADSGRNGPTLTMAAIARELGVERRSLRWQRDYVASLIAKENFPAPLPILKGGVLSRDIQPTRSRWLAAGVRAWLGDQLPVEATEQADREAATAAADRLAAAADNLFGGDAA
jgi:hypothetical protein